MINRTTFLMELGGLLIKKGSQLVFQGLCALLGGLILAIYVVLASFPALVGEASRKDLFESVSYTLKKWVGRG